MARLSIDPFRVPIMPPLLGVVVKSELRRKMMMEDKNKKIEAFLLKVCQDSSYVEFWVQVLVFDF